MSIFRDLFFFFVYQPELNILYFFDEYTDDFGYAVVLLAIAVNLLIFPLFAKNYINLQKTRVLQPYIRQIQEKYKQDPQLMLKKMGEFNKKHGINNTTSFLVLFVQLFFISGLFFLVRDVVNNGQVDGLYEWLFGTSEAIFKDGDNPILAFGSLDISQTPQENNNYLFIPVISAILSFSYGFYTFKLAPQPKLPELKPKKKTKKKKDEPAEPAMFDPEAMQKTLQFQSMVILPLFLLFVQYTFQTGVNIYFLTSSAISLIRQVILTNYYNSHILELIERIKNSDPTTDGEIDNDDDMDNLDPLDAVKSSISDAIKETKKNTKKISGENLIEAEIVSEKKTKKTASKSKKGKAKTSSSKSKSKNNL